MSSTSANIDDEVLRLQSLGLTNAQMASELGASRSAVWRATARLGSPTRNRRIRPAETWVEVERLLQDGCSALEAARTVGVTVQSVLAHFPGRGWSPRQSNDHRRAMRASGW